MRHTNPQLDGQLQIHHYHPQSRCNRKTREWAPSSWHERRSGVPPARGELLWCVNCLRARSVGGGSCCRAGREKCDISHFPSKCEARSVACAISFEILSKPSLARLFRLRQARALHRVLLEPRLSRTRRHINQRPDVPPPQFAVSMLQCSNRPNRVVAITALACHPSHAASAFLMGFVASKAPLLRSAQL